MGPCARGGPRGDFGSWLAHSRAQISKKATKGDKDTKENKLAKWLKKKGVEEPRRDRRDRRECPGPAPDGALRVVVVEDRRDRSRRGRGTNVKRGTREEPERP